MPAPVTSPLVGVKQSELQTATSLLPDDLVTGTRPSEPDPSKRNLNFPVGLLGGGGAPFTITPTENVGGIVAGQTYANVTAEGLLRAMLVRYQAPAFVYFTIAGQGSQTVEVGTPFLAGFKSVAWGTLNSGNVKPASLKLQDVTAGTTLSDNEANDGTLSASTAGFTASNGESRRYRLSGVNSNNATFSADVVITGSYALFFGPTSAAPTTSAAARGLPQSQLAAKPAADTQERTAILNTGTTALKLAIVLPPGRTLQSVTDLDNQGLNLTAKYVAQAPISVNDASGAPVPGYTPYVLSIATPYTSSARHQFTYA
jgi:hypothetical protein